MSPETSNHNKSHVQYKSLQNLALDPNFELHTLPKHEHQYIQPPYVMKLSRLPVISGIRYVKRKTRGGDPWKSVEEMSALCAIQAKENVKRMELDMKFVARPA